MNSKLVKVISCCASLMIAAGTFCGITEIKTTVKAELSVGDLEAQKIENDKKIAELEKEIELAQAQYDLIVSDEAAKQEYQDALNEKISIQNENISYVVEQMNQIDSDIQDTMSNISEIEHKIKMQNFTISDNMELYRKRLRASYMSGGSNLAAILSGSGTFTDMLSKFEIISKVAEHDKNLIAKLEKQLRELKDLNSSLEDKQEELSADLADAAGRKNELDERLSVLQDDFHSTQEELDRITGEKYIISENIEENEEIIALKKAEQQKIDDEIEAIMEQLRLESISASESVSQSVAESIAESEAAASRKAEEERKKREEEAANMSKPVTEAPPASEPEPETPAPSSPAPSDPYVEDSSLLYWPVPGFYRLSSEYGEMRSSGGHYAIDIQGHGGSNGYVTIEGAEVRAADNGIVAGTHSGCTHYGNPGDRCGGGYGNYVSIAHNDGVYSSIYAHLLAVYVSPGQRVKKGDLIGLVGNTGSSTGPHLHYALKKNGSPVNPHSVGYMNYGG